MQSPPHSSGAGKEGKQFGVPMEAEGFVTHMRALLEDVQVRGGGAGVRPGMYMAVGATSRIAYFICGR